MMNGRTSHTAGTAAASTEIAPTLCVDLDGTLIASDVLWESTLLLLRERPWLAFALPFWLARGKAYLKQQIAARVQLDVERLPYRDEVVQYLTEESHGGRPIVLVTPSHESVARRVAQHVGLFSGVLASDAQTNLSGTRKAERLANTFGSGGFDYLGNDRVDIPTWKAGRRVIVVAPSWSLLRRIRATPLDVERILAQRRGTLRALVRVMRPHQWVKNLLSFVPLVTSHRLLDLRLMERAFEAFVAFSLCASTVYVVNDLFDIQSDRRHPRKRFRPFAVGELPISHGIVLAPILLVLAFATAIAMLPPSFAALLGLYLITATAYSWFLKRQPILDVMVLAGLYALRVLAGGVATGIVISQWLLPFALFLFLSLALMKRFSEIKKAPAGVQTLSGRAYRVEDAVWVQAAGLCAAYLAVLVLALYISSSEVTTLYRRPQVLWGLCPVFLYWVTRLWFHAHRGWVKDDPVVAAVADPASYAVAAVGGLILLAAI